MTFLPIVERELRVAARRRGMFWTRLGAAAAAVVFGGAWVWLSEESASARSIGTSMFAILSVAALLFCLVSGPIFGVDALAEEKREGTLGLLFLTDLKGHDVVLGKLAASSVTALFSLLAILPVLALSILFGGTSLGEFCRVAVALLNTLFFSLSISMLVSVCSRQARTAFALNALVLVFLCLFLPWLEELLPGGHAGVLRKILASFNPVFTIELARTWAQAGRGQDYYGAIATVHVLAWLALGLTSWIVSRVWREHRFGLRLKRLSAKSSHWSFGEDGRRRDHRRTMLDRNPILWLGSRNLLKRRLLWGATAFALGVWTITLFLGRDWSDWPMTIMIAYFLQTPLKWLMASEATHRWVEDQQSGALELLLTTPLTTLDILRGHLRALGRMFLPPALALVGFELLALGVGSQTPGTDVETGISALLLLVLFLWDLHTLAWLGMWLGLSRRRTNRAFLEALFRVQGVPVLLLLAAIIVVGPESFPVFALIWIVPCGACNLVCYLSARSKLRRTLHAVPTDDRRERPTRAAWFGVAPKSV